ncbi:MAG: tetratricopeptide repeat protein [Armatimonadetes bacterium]|nr:tetratricopeptide repeat protein [Armatimonadota bacterium]
MAESSNHDLAAAHASRVNGDYETAHGLYRSIVGSDPGAAEAWWGLGLTLMNMGEFDESIACLEKAAELDPSSQRYLLDLAKHQTMLGMFDEAKPVFERVIEIDGSSREADEARNQLRYY